MPRKPKKPTTSNKVKVSGRALTPTFKVVFTMVNVITILCLIGYIVLAVLFPENDAASRLNGVLETLKSAFTLGFGAIVGLMGGKAL